MTNDELRGALCANEPCEAKLPSRAALCSRARLLRERRARRNENIAFALAALAFVAVAVLAWRYSPRILLALPVAAALAAPPIVLSLERERDSATQ